MSSEDKPIGYGNPPAHTQWKPGQSGNPLGRPKKSVRLVEAFLAEANSTITISEQGHTQDVLKLHAVVKSLFAKALKGDIRAIALLFKHWNPTEIAALEWYEEQKHKSLMKSIARARTILAEVAAKKAGKLNTTEAAPPDDDDLELDEFVKAANEADKKGEVLSWVQFQAQNGKPEQYIGDT